MSEQQPTIRKVLLIDDDSEEHELFRLALHHVYPNIELNCIDSFFTKPLDRACDIPDLAFIDINMPQVNGYEWVLRLRDKGYCFPIVMYSTSVNPVAIETAYSIGANLYLQKPFTFSELTTSLKKVLSLNWNQPEKITQSYYNNGRYRDFRPNSD